ncbi:hypothetical protein [Serratia microhaemolytica]|uniref:hypothetical protein n=1 Tax=Serratia microhaemolytica TaxID=2675110 RepID=UPI000FDF0330|nr:hypothetical protein [Serratia microhaemolytica]
MIKLLEDLKWSPNGCVIEIIRAGEYQPSELPERAIAIASQLNIICSVDSGDDGQNAGQEQQSEQEQEPESEPQLAQQAEPAKKGKK